MAPNKKNVQEQLTSWRARMVADTARLRKAEETNPADWWRDRHKKGHMIMNRYETDPNKEKHCHAGGQAT